MCKQTDFHRIPSDISFEIPLDVSFPTEFHKSLCEITVTIMWIYGEMYFKGTVAGSECLEHLSWVIQDLKKNICLLLVFWLPESSGRLILLELHSSGTSLANAPFDTLIIAKKIKCLLKNIVLGGEARKTSSSFQHSEFKCSFAVVRSSSAPRFL